MIRLLSSLSVACAVALSVLALSSCATDPYSSDPEGTTYDSVPAGYTALLVGGISYWYYDDHYCRYWPGYGYIVVPPPYGRPPYTRPPGVGPGRPIKPAPTFPGYRPGRPPGTNPPGINPPATRPSQPSIQPVTGPSTRPVTNPNRQIGSPGFSGGGFGGGGMRGGGRGGRR